MHLAPRELIHSLQSSCSLEVSAQEEDAPRPVIFLQFVEGAPNVVAIVMVQAFLIVRSEEILRRYRFPWRPARSENTNDVLTNELILRREPIARVSVGTQVLRP